MEKETSIVVISLILELKNPEEYIGIVVEKKLKKKLGTFY